MKILLIYPPSANPLLDQVYMHEPLALEYLAAGLKLKGHEVKILDARLEPNIIAAHNEFKPDIVGLTAFTNHLSCVKKIAAELKQINPKLLIIVGGHHATVSPDDFNQQYIDVVVIGEGVQAICDIAHCHEIGVSFKGISGLGLPQPTAKLQRTQPRFYTELDDLPLPDRTLTQKYRRHYFGEWLKPLASIRTSLGCTSRCNFCALWPITGGKYLRRSVTAVVKELQTIDEKNIFFCDDESMCDVDRMDELANAIKLAGIRKKYFLYARADTIVNHPELFAKWREIGLDQVFVGMESFSDERLQHLHKNISLIQQQQTVQILQSLGVTVYANFIVDPNFSKKDFAQLTTHIRQLGLRHVGFSVLTPLPGTELYRRRRHELTTDNPELYDMVHAVLPTRLELDEFYSEMLNLYTKTLPLRATVRTLLRYGPRRILGQLRLLARFSRYLKKAHLET